MGTRADFYIGMGTNAEWLGSIAYDGYPDGYPEMVLGIESEDAFRDAVSSILNDEQCDHATLPEQGWPWPWDDSCTTDYAYCFDNGQVRTFCFGREVLPEDETEDGDVLDNINERPEAPFPNMKDRKNVTLGKRSGLLLIGIPE